MSTLRSVAEIGYGVLFAMGALFNAVYTMSHGDEFFGSFAEGAWLPPARWAIEKVVIPNAVAVAIVLVLWEATVAVMIFTRGDLVQPALYAGACFAIIGAAASNPGGTIANLVLAGGLIGLAVTR